VDKIEDVEDVEEGEEDASSSEGIEDIEEGEEGVSSAAAAGTASEIGDVTGGEAREENAAEKGWPRKMNDTPPLPSPEASTPCSGPSSSPPTPPPLCASCPCSMGSWALQLGHEELLRSQVRIPGQLPVSFTPPSP